MPQSTSGCLCRLLLPLKYMRAHDEVHCVMCIKKKKSEKANVFHFKKQVWSIKYRF